MCKEKPTTVTVEALPLKNLIEACAAVHWNAEEYIKEPNDISLYDLRAVIDELLASAASVSTSILENL